MEKKEKRMSLMEKWSRQKRLCALFVSKTPARILFLNATLSDTKRSLSSTLCFSLSPNIIAPSEWKSFQSVCLFAKEKLFVWPSWQK